MIRKVIIFQFIIFFSFLSSNAHADILKSQKYLNALGYNSGAEDGIWGKKTENALKSFLNDVGIAWDGKLDRKDVKALENSFKEKGLKFQSPDEINSFTSTDNISGNFCDLIGNSSSNVGQSVGQVGRIHSYLTVPLTQFSPIEFFEDNASTTRSDGKSISVKDLNSGVGKLHFEKGIVVDLGGDGVLDHVTKIVNFSDPKHKLPIFIWPDSKKNKKHRANKYGFGSSFGIEIEELHIDKILPGDFNSDNIIDLAFLDYGEHDYDNHRNLMGGSIVVALSLGKKKYITKKITKPNNLWHHGVVVDFNNDGKLDLVAVGGSAPTRHNLKSAYVFINQGNGDFANAEAIGVPTTATSIAVGASDITGDKQPEIVFANTARKKGHTTSISIFKGKNLVQTYKVKNNSKWTVPDLVFADVNKDGIKDIVLVQSPYNLANPPSKHDRLTALIIENGRVANEQVIFDANKMKLNFVGQGFFGHIVGCNTKIFVLNRSRTLFWRVY